MRGGGDRFGPDFLRWSAKGFGQGCDCNAIACKSAGYSPSQGAICIPVPGHATDLGMPYLLSKEKIEQYKKAASKNNKIFLYPLHFFPEHQTQIDGKWKLLFDKKATIKYKDMERRSYDFPPPRYAPRLFIQDEYFCNYTRPQDR